MKIIQRPSPHFNERTLDVDSIIIHYTDMRSADETLAWFSNPLAHVSSHYLIDQEGHIYQVVEEDKRAWHAGESYWQGCTDLNSCSIGIELDNLGHSYGYHPFPEAQIDALLMLCEDIRTRWPIPPFRILGHSDVAPCRKQDPGHLFPWEKLARAGLGLWPTKYDELTHPGLPRSQRSLAMTIPSSIICRSAPRSDHPEASLRDPQKRGEAIQKISPSTMSILIEGLEKIGYETVSPSHTLLAFQRHFQPHKLDGIADQETFSLLQALLKTQEKHI